MGAALSFTACTTWLVPLHEPMPEAAEKLPLSVPLELAQRIKPLEGVPGNMKFSPDAATDVGAAKLMALAVSAGAAPDSFEGRQLRLQQESVFALSGSRTHPACKHRYSQPHSGNAGNSQ